MGIFPLPEIKIKNLARQYQERRNDGTYDFYYGDVTVTVSGNFGIASLYCYYHGYMGGENILKYISIDNDDISSLFAAGITAAQLKTEGFTLTELTTIPGPDPITEAVANMDQSNGIAFANFVRTDEGLTSIDVVLPPIDGTLLTMELTINFQELFEKYPELHNSYEDMYDLPFDIEGIGNVENTWHQAQEGGGLRITEITLNDWVSGPIFRISITMSTGIDNGVDMIKLFVDPYGGRNQTETQHNGWTERQGNSYIDGEASTVSYTATELQEAGFTITELMTTEFTRDEIIKAGFTITELKAAEFTLAELIIHNGPDPVTEALANLDQNNGLAFTNFVRTDGGDGGDGGDDSQYYSYGNYSDGTGLTSIDVVLPETPELNGIKIVINEQELTGLIRSGGEHENIFNNPEFGFPPFTAEGIGNVSAVLDEFTEGAMVYQLSTNGWVSGPVIRIHLHASLMGLTSASGFINIFQHPNVTNTTSTSGQGADVSRVGNSYIEGGEAPQLGAFTATVLIADGFTLSEVITAGASVAQLKAAGFTLAELKDDFTLVQLVTGGFTVAELKNDFTVAELVTAGASVSELKDAFTLAELITAGASAAQLKNDFTATELKNDFTLAELKAAGFTVTELKAAGFTATELKAAGFTVAELKAAGFTATELKTAGFTALELKNDFTLAELKNDFTLVELKAVGFTAAELKNDFTLAELLAAGFTVTELKAAGFTVAELKDDFTLAELKTAVFTAAQLKNDFTLAELKAVGFTAAQLQVLEPFTLAELKAAGFTATELSTPLQEPTLAERGENALWNLDQDLGQPWITRVDYRDTVDPATGADGSGIEWGMIPSIFENGPIDSILTRTRKLRDDGTWSDLGPPSMANNIDRSSFGSWWFNLKDWDQETTDGQSENAARDRYNADRSGFPPLQLYIEIPTSQNDENTTKYGAVETLYFYPDVNDPEGTFSFHYPKPAPPFNTTELIAGGFTEAEVTLAELIASGGTLAELVTAGASVSELKDAGFTVTELKNDFTLVELVTGGFTVTELKNDFTVTELKDDFTLAEFKTDGFTASELKDAFTLAELVTGGFTAAELKTAFTATELKDDFTLAELKAGGFTASELKAAGFTLAELVTAGFTAAELKAAGFTATELKRQSEPTLAERGENAIYNLDTSFVDLDGSSQTPTNSYYAGIHLGVSDTLFEGIDSLKITKIVHKYEEDTGSWSNANIIAVNQMHTSPTEPPIYFTWNYFADGRWDGTPGTKEEAIQRYAADRSGFPPLKIRLTTGELDAMDLTGDTGDKIEDAYFYPDTETFSFNYPQPQGFTLAELKAGGFTATELKDAFTLAELVTAGFTLAELKNDFTLAELKDDFTLAELKAGGFTATELKDAFTLAELVTAGFTLAELKNDFTLAELKTAGFTITELGRGAEITTEPTLAERGSNAIFDLSTSEIDTTSDQRGIIIGILDNDNLQLDFPVKIERVGYKYNIPGNPHGDEAWLANPNSNHDKTGFYYVTCIGTNQNYDSNPTEIVMRWSSLAAGDWNHVWDGGTYGGTGPEMLERYIADRSGFPPIMLRLRAGEYGAYAKEEYVYFYPDTETFSFNYPRFGEPSFTLAELKDAFTLAELKAGGFTASELKAAGFTPTELKTADFTATELKAAGFTATELKAGGFTLVELKADGFTVTELKTAFTITELKVGGFTATELKAGGFTLVELKAAGFTASELKNDFTLAELGNFQVLPILNPIDPNYESASSSGFGQYLGGTQSTPDGGMQEFLTVDINDNHTLNRSFEIFTVDIKVSNSVYLRLDPRGWSDENVPDKLFQLKIKYDGDSDYTYVSDIQRLQQSEGTVSKTLTFTNVDFTTTGKYIFDIDINFDGGEGAQGSHGGSLYIFNNSTNTPLTGEVADNYPGFMGAWENRDYFPFVILKTPDLFPPVFTLAELKAGGFTLAELKDDFTLVQLVTGGFTVTELKNDFTVAELVTAGASVSELKDAFTLAELITAGASVSELKNAFTLAELLTAGFTAAELKAAGFTVVELGIGVEIPEPTLAERGQYAMLEYATFDEAGTGFHFYFLESIFLDPNTTYNFYRRMFRLDDNGEWQYIEGGGSLPSYSDRWAPSHWDWLGKWFDGTVRTWQDLQALYAEDRTLFPPIKIEYNITAPTDHPLFQAAYEAQDYMYFYPDTETFSFNYPRFNEQGFTLAELLTAGFTAAELKTAFTLAELKDDFTLAELKAGGFTATELKDAFTLAELLTAGFTAAELKDAFTLAELKDDFTLAEFKTGGFTASELKDAFTLAELLTAGFTAAELKAAGFTITELKDDFTLAEFKTGGFTASELKDAFTLAELLTAGFTAAELKAAGFTVVELGIGAEIPEPTLAERGSKAIFDLSTSEIDTTSVQRGIVMGILDNDNLQLDFPVLIERAGYKYNIPGNPHGDEAWLANPNSNHNKTGFYYITCVGVNQNYDSKPTEIVMRWNSLARGDWNHVWDGGTYRGSGSAMLGRYIADRSGFPPIMLRLRAGEYGAYTKEEYVYFYPDTETFSFNYPRFGEPFFTLAELKNDFTATELKDHFTLAELKGAGFTPTELKTADFTVAELKAGGFTATELLTAGFTLAELVTGGFTATELKGAGFTVTELKAQSEPTIEERGQYAMFENPRFDAASELGEVFAFDVLSSVFDPNSNDEFWYLFSRLEDNGDWGAFINGATTNMIEGIRRSWNMDWHGLLWWSVDQHDGNYLVVKDRYLADRSLFPPVRIGLNIQNSDHPLFQAAYVAQEYIYFYPDTETFSFHYPKPEGFTLTELKAGGFTVAELKDDFTLAELKTAGFTATELKGAGFTAAQLKTEGFTLTELKAGGFTVAELKDDFTLAELKTAVFTAAQLKNDFTLVELKAGGFTATELKGAGFTPTELKAGGFTATELKGAGFTLAELLTAGFTLAELKTAFTATELKDDFTLAELKVGGFTATELKAGGFTVVELKAVEFTLAELKTAGFTATEFKNDFTLVELKAGGFTATELKGAGFTPTELKAVEFTLAELKAGGFTATELKNDFTLVELVTGGFTATELKDDFTVTELVTDEAFTGIELKTGGFTATELKNDFTLAELIILEYSTSNLIDAGFTPLEIGNNGLLIGFKEAGLSVTEAVAAGLTSASLLKADGYTAKECKSDGFTLAELKEGGFTVAELIVQDGFEVTNGKN